MIKVAYILGKLHSGGENIKKIDKDFAFSLFLHTFADKSH